MGIAGGGWGGCCAAARGGPAIVYISGTQVQSRPSSRLFLYPGLGDAVWCLQSLALPPNFHQGLGR